MASMPYHLRLLAACLVLSGASFAKPIVQVANESDGFVLRGYGVAVDERSGTIRLELSADDAARLATLSAPAVTIAGTTAPRPIIQDVGPGPALTLTFDDPSTFAAVRAALSSTPTRSA